MLLGLGCALTYDVEQRESEIARHEVGIVDCRGERESFSIPQALWREISAP